MRAARLAIVLAFAHAGVADDALAVTARWQKHWRNRSHVPPLPYPETLRPQDVPRYPTGFVMTVTKARDAGASPVDIARPRDVAERLAACWRPPVSAQPGEITLRLQFSMTGAAIGQPKITYVKSAPGEGARAAMVKSILVALADCAPLRFTSTFGKAIAGYPFAIRFIAAAPD